MSERLTQPTAVIEGRAPLPAHLMPDGREQAKTRQTELPIILARLRVNTLFIEPQDPATYEEPERAGGSAGRIKKYTPYGATEPVDGILEPGSYAWRLRDSTWPNGDPAAHRDGDGYNNSARYTLRTRTDVWRVLQKMGLEAYGIKTFTEPHARDWTAERAVLLKPDIISDISNIGEHPGTRAHLVAGRDLEAKLAEITFAGGVILQQPEPLPATDLMAQLGIEADNSKADYLHAIRVFSLAGVTPAVELRLTNPQASTDNPQGDIGKLFATERHLLPPEQAFGRLRAFATVHTLMRNAFAARYGENKLLCFRLHSS